MSAANSLTYAYDSRGRLSMVEQLGGGQIVYNRQDYLYDANGNRTAHERRFTKGQIAPDQTETYTRTPGTNRLARECRALSEVRMCMHDKKQERAGLFRPALTLQTGLEPDDYQSFIKYVVVN